MSCTAKETHFLENLRVHLIDLSRRLEQDSGDDVADYVLYRLQQVARHFLAEIYNFRDKYLKEYRVKNTHISILKEAK